MNKKFKKILVWMLAAVLAASFTGCSASSSVSSVVSSPSVYSSSLSEPFSSSESSMASSEQKNSEADASSEAAYQIKVPQENREQLKKMREELNSDIVCWLQVPNTEINKVIVQASDNDYYSRRNVDKQYLMEGTLRMDYECDLKDGTKSDMPQNTIIYGNNLGNPLGISDDPNGPEFAQLFHFTDIKFAKANPYIYLSTDEEDFIYQVFAVVYTEVNMKPVNYIYTSYSAEDYTTFLKDIRARSIYSYPDIEVTTSDKILTLFTATYKYGTYAQNDQQAFIIFARLVQDESFSATANVEINPNPKEPDFSRQE